MEQYELTSTPELLTLAAYVSKDGLVGHHWKERPFLIHMQLESRAQGYWLVPNVLPIGLQIPLAPWILSLAPPLGAL